MPGEGRTPGAERRRLRHIMAKYTYKHFRHADDDDFILAAQAFQRISSAAALAFHYAPLAAIHIHAAAAPDTTRDCLPSNYFGQCFYLPPLSPASARRWPDYLTRSLPRSR